MTPTRAYVEVGAKKAIASAADWPGWCRIARDEASALRRLAEYADRYRPVAAAAGHPLPKGAEDRLEVVERKPGDSTTDFGAPHVHADEDRRPWAKGEVERQAALVQAAWDHLERVAAGAPAELRKGPRGGGRDRDKILQHVLGAEAAYAGALGARLKEPAFSDAAAVHAFRAALLEALASDEGRWPSRYGARRIAWHALDHAWEIEDRS